MTLDSVWENRGDVGCLAKDNVQATKVFAVIDV